MHLRKSGRKGKFNSKVAFEKKLAVLNTAQATKVKISKKKGKFTAGKVTLREIALNNKVLRLNLLRENLKDLKKKKSPVKTSSKSKPAKQKLKSFTSDKKAIPLTQHPLKKNQSNSKPLKIKLFNKNLSPKRKMVVNNGKVSKYDPDDYFIKKLKSKANGQMFFLKPCPYKNISEGKLNYKFHQLVNDVKNMQLPTPLWKIKVIIRHNKIAAIIFTNKAELERSLSFNSDDEKYHILIDNKPALLLGSPGKVNSCNEIEVLLSIMENIEKDSYMIVYK